ncbi:MAG: hypothetical protein ACRDDH_16910 [Cetobacterium sp.]|uniref:hypothetical protein n=1 Tax=Cetobacterium sp. TaxID=2071632 RepID=UPI003EE55CDB
MKKVLLGLLAVSAASIAGELDLSGPAVTGTNIFEGKNIGQMSVTGKIMSDIPLVKYVLFASPDDGATIVDKLELPNYILSQDSSKAGLQGQSSKVFIKRVVGGAIADLDPTEVARFSIQTKFSSSPEWLAFTAGKRYWNIIGTLSDSQLAAISSRIGSADYAVESNGVVNTGIKHVPTQKVYVPRNIMTSDIIAPGVMQFKPYTGQGVHENKAMATEHAEVVERAFGQEVTNFVIQAKID